MKVSSDTLVLGYGNPLRGDDAAGYAVAEIILSVENSHVDAISAHQLLPEHAELISRYRKVFFVDASADTSLKEMEVTLLNIMKQDLGSLHESDPASILSLCKALYDSQPEATLIAIPAQNFDFGETLSHETEIFVRHAVDFILNRSKEPPSRNARGGNA